MTSKKSDEKMTIKNRALTDDIVLGYLKEHPNFLIKNPEALTFLNLPKDDLGNNVVDFQSFAIKKLQENIKDTNQQFSSLIDSARDNNSAQSRVHLATLKLIQTRSLEDLLEIISIDFAQLFNVDVVRLAMESDIKTAYEGYYSEHNPSGIVFVEKGLAEMLFGADGSALICEDLEENDILGTEQIFAECEWLVRSCIILRLQIENDDKAIFLAFGSREAERFNASMGVDLLEFLGDVVGECMINHIDDMGPIA